MYPATKQNFAAELTKADPDLNLAYAALLISQHLTQAGDISPYLVLLDEMAEEARPAIEAAPTPSEKMVALHFYLFDQLKFRGNARRYYDPNNSFLNKVLEVKRGIPISLSMVYLEIGWRLGLPVWGVGMPGHFIVGYGSSATPVYVDVFNQGQLLSEEDCLTLCNIREPQRLTFKEQFLRPATKKEILFRILLNLKQIYVKRENWSAAYAAVDLMLVVRPDQIGEFKDRGLLAYRLDRLHDALFDLKRYLFLVPMSPDKAWLEDRINLMEERLAQLN